MTSDRIDFHSAVAVEESPSAGETAPWSKLQFAQARPDATPAEDLAAISMSTNLLALNGVLTGGTLAAAPGTRLAGSVRQHSSHASICLAKRVFDIVFATVALLTF